MHYFPLYYGGMEGATRARRRFKAARAPSRQGPVGRFRADRGARPLLRWPGIVSLCPAVRHPELVQRIAIRGRRHELGLGSTRARPTRRGARQGAGQPQDRPRGGATPLAEKRRAEITPTFAAAAARVLEQKQAGWSNSRHESTWIRSLETYAFRGSEGDWCPR